MEIINGNGYQQIWSLQKGLLDKYIIRGDMPQYPLGELDSRNSQKLIKKLSDWVIEELSESFNSIKTAWISMDENNINYAKQCIRNYNEEIADTLHFMTESLIYLNWDVNALDNMLRAYLEELNMSGLYRQLNPLKTFLNLGHFLNTTDDLIKRDPTRYTIFTLSEIVKNPENTGAACISQRDIIQHAILSWDITFRFKMATNTLKNRDWSKEDKKANLILFDERMLSTLIVYFQYLDYAGFTEAAIFKSYYLKNQINHERIENGY